MDRLTKRTPSGVAILNHSSCFVYTGIRCGRTASQKIQAAIEQLAAIEDILGEDYDLDRLRELVEADRDGRCVVLPVKVGDTVYDTTIEDITGEIRVMTVVSVVFFLSKSFNRLDFHAENYRGAFMTFEHRDIGKSVFRTREAAEAALKGGAYGG